MKHLFTRVMALAMCLGVLAGCSGKGADPSASGSVSAGASSSGSQSAPEGSQPDVSTPDVSAPDGSASDISGPDSSGQEDSQPAQSVLTLSKSDFTLKSAGASWTLTYTCTPQLSPAPAAQYTSSDESVAAVDESGTVTAVAPGTAVITLTYGELTAQCIVRCRWEESTESKNVDLAAFYADLAGRYDLSLLEQIEDDVILESFYAELLAVPTAQRVVTMCVMNPAPIGDIVLVQAADDGAVEAVKQALQNRIQYMVGDGNGPGGAWYPEPTDMWENESRIAVNGYYVMLVVGESCDSIVADFNALF